MRVLLVVLLASAEKGVFVIPPPENGTVKVVFEAEDALKLTPIIEIKKDSRRLRRKSEEYRSSGGLFLEIPDHTPGKKENEGGSALYKIKVSRSAWYYIWVRVWWTDGCGNSLNYSIDGSKPSKFGEDGTYKVWHWQPIKPRGAYADKIRLKAGEHTLVLSHSEDGVRIDQIFITTDSKVVPQGILQ